MVTTTEAKMRFTSDPKQSPKPGEHDPMKPGEHVAPQQASEEESGGGPTPRVAQTQMLVLSNFSVAPGPLWLEFTNSTALALTVGANTMTANLPISGSGWLFGEEGWDKPILAGVFPAAPTDEREEGLPVPQSNKKLTNVTAMPASCGIRNVTINKTSTPRTLTINVIAQAAGTVPINSRWVVTTVQGV